jgi:hypothetical protein
MANLSIDWNPIGEAIEQATANSAIITPMDKKQKIATPSVQKPEDKLIKAHEVFMNTVLNTPESDRAGEELLRIVFQGGRRASAPSDNK